MKTKTRFLSAAVLLVLTALLLLTGRFAPAFFARWYPGFSQTVLGAIGAVTGEFPLPLWELGVGLLALWAIVSLLRSLKKHRFWRWLAGLVWAGSFLLFAFVTFWGAGHLLPTKAEQIVSIQPVSVRDLTAAAEYFAAKLDSLAPKMLRDEQGRVQMADFPHLSEEAEDCYDELAEQYACIPEADMTAKKLWFGDLFGYLGYTGIFVPVTAEPTVSPHTYPASLPFTVCHEMGHRVGACAEEDANFLAFLACLESEDPQFLYSAYYSAFIYCYNALHKAAPQTAEGVFLSMGDEAKREVAQASGHYKPYEGKIQDAAEKFNDTYLKAAGQEAGTASYGLVSDALVAWYLKNAEN